MPLLQGLKWPLLLNMHYFHFFSDDMLHVDKIKILQVATACVLWKAIATSFNYNIVAPNI